MSSTCIHKGNSGMSCAYFRDSIIPTSGAKHDQLQHAFGNGPLLQTGPDACAWFAICILATACVAVLRVLYLCIIPQSQVPPEGSIQVCTVLVWV
jgi:hypothetical protein